VKRDGRLNADCTEPVNFAFIQKNGVPTGPPGPASATAATLTPNARTLMMNQGDRIRITTEDTPAGLPTIVQDLTTREMGFMVASAADGFQGTDPDTCAPAAFSFHPEFDTAKFGNFVPWAALQANINFSMEIGHFIPGPRGDRDADDKPCFPGPTVAGCIGADIDFDGTSYRRDWPDGRPTHATSLAIASVAGISANGSRYSEPFPIVQFETDLGASERGCRKDGTGCVVPPAGARFYPFYALIGDPGSLTRRSRDGCALLFGNFSGPDIENFGVDRQYGAPNLSSFYGQNTSGPVGNPCPPRIAGQ
jgi:hypothetical protein